MRPDEAAASARDRVAEAGARPLAAVWLARRPLWPGPRRGFVAAPCGPEAGGSEPSASLPLLITGWLRQLESWWPAWIRAGFSPEAR
mmetsp:Transcript_120900/g.337377  ORF Transcript_120900/g.337377 Transcript_120900/m.337377 type:complete len:87 (-) Transcript_120900:431-691(-)